MRTWRHQAGLLLVAAVALGSAGCGAAGTGTPIPSTAELRQALIGVADLPAGYRAWNHAIKSRSFCGHSYKEHARVGTYANFDRPDGLDTTFVAVKVGVFPSKAAAKRNIDESRSLLTTTCHEDDHAKDKLSLALMTVPAAGQAAIGVHEVVTPGGAGSKGGLPAGFRLMWDVYLVADGRAVIEVVVIGRESSDSTLIQAMRRQITRLNTTKIPG